MSIDTERRENETSREYGLRLFNARKAEALADLPSKRLGDGLPEPTPGEPEAIVRLRRELARLAAIADEKVLEAFDAEEAMRRAHDAQSDSHSAACKVLHELRAIFDNAELVVLQRNGRGRRRTFVEALPDRAPFWTLHRKAEAMNAQFEQDGRSLVAEVRERSLPPGVYEEPVEAEAELAVA